MKKIANLKKTAAFPRAGFLALLFVVLAATLHLGASWAEAAQTTVSWTAPSNYAGGMAIPDLIGYNLHVGTAPGNYSQTIEVGDVTSYTVDNLASGTTYYFAVTAYDSLGNESGYSAEVSSAGQTSVLSQPTLVSSFLDVPSNDIFTSYINAIYAKGITTGCGNGDYCPTLNVPRNQMAAFIIRALYGENFTYTQIPYFTDVPATDFFFKYVQKMKDMGLTAVNGTYMPSDYVTREQMAAFLIRAVQMAAGQDTENFSYTPTPYFADVPATSIYFKYVQKLKDAGITAVTGTYNASSNVTREEMAAFIARAFLGMS